jgi:4-alpha-glucanotransferase
MQERSVYSYRVLLFEKHPDGRFKGTAEYPRRAIATVTTHDLPTLKGYWTANDIELRSRLALYPNDEIRGLVADERTRDRSALLVALQEEGLKPADCDGTAQSYGQALSLAIHEFLARSSAALVVVQAEDLVGMANPVNVPGTSDEHANWQRKMSREVAAIFGDAGVRRLLDAVQAARTP